jgi:hypothetical protein
MDQLSSSETRSSAIEPQTERETPLGEVKPHPYDSLRLLGAQEMTPEEKQRCHESIVQAKEREHLLRQAN